MNPTDMIGRMSGRRQSLVRRVALSAVPLALYIAVALLLFGRGGSWTKRYFGQGPDPFLFTWSLNWWPFAISHGLGPFISDYIWYPHGSNLAWSTSVPSAALLGLPITLLGGPVLSFNILSQAAPALSAWTAFLLAAFLTRDWAAALVGGYFFGFSSYELGQLLGHLNLDLTFVVPLAVLLCLRHLSGVMRRIAFIAAMAVLLLFELGLSSEILATLCVIGAIAWVIFLAFGPAAERPAMGRLAIDIVVAAALAGLIATPFMVYLVEGLADVSPQNGMVTMFSADPLNYVLPTVITRFGRTVFWPLSVQFTGNLSEQGAYLGFPLLFLMALYFRDTIARSHSKALLVTMATCVVLSLGPWLHMQRLLTAIPLPWLAAVKLPLIRAALPIRLTMYVSLGSAIATSLYLATPVAPRWRIWRFALAGFAGIVLLPNTLLYGWTPWPTQAFFTPSHVRQALGVMPKVVVLPFGFEAPGMAWQLNSGMAFKQAGGYVGLPPYTEWRWPIQLEFASGIAGPGFADDLASYCVTHRLQYVLVGPGTPGALVTAIARLGWSQHSDHGVSVVRVPDPSELHYSYIRGDYWPGPGPANWMGRKVQVVTHGRSASLQVTGNGPSIVMPVDLRVDDGSRETTLRVNPGDTKTISMPRDATITLTASGGFVPDRVIHNGDRRSLSVLLTLQPILPGSKVP